MEASQSSPLVQLVLRIVNGSFQNSIKVMLYIARKQVIVILELLQMGYMKENSISFIIGSLIEVVKL